MTAVISGVGSISPYGRNEATIVDNLRNERIMIEAYQSNDRRTKATSAARCIHESQTLAPSLSPRIATDVLNVTYAVVKDAVEDAGLSMDDLKGHRVALCSGCGAADMDSMRALVSHDYPRVNPFDLMKTLPTAVTGPLATALGLRGPVHTVQHACATGLRTVTQGMDLIKLGRADIVVCVSVEKLLDEAMRGFDAMRALYRGEDLTFASVPFTKERAGFTASEGAGCVILESDSHFQTRKGRKAYGQPIAYADYSDGEDLTNPSGVGAYQCLLDVMADMAELGHSVDFISAHGTSTPNGDVIEAKSILNSVGDEVPVVAFKRLIGHTVTASGIIELIFSLYQMKHNFVISNGAIKPDPGVHPLYLPTEQLEMPVNAFVKNAFGFGGLNCVLGVARYV